MMLEMKVYPFPDSYPCHAYHMTYTYRNMAVLIITSELDFQSILNGKKKKKEEKRERAIKFAEVKNKPSHCYCGVKII